MNCPHCQKELPVAGSISQCPGYGSTLGTTPATGKSFLALLGKILLVMFWAALILVGAIFLMMAILFAGCLIMSHTGKL